MLKYSSLKYFRLVKENTHTSGYLCSRNSFNSIKLKFKLRCGVSELGEDLHRQGRDSGYCKYCGCYETLKHFLFHCHAYTHERTILYKNLKFSCEDNVFNMFLQNLDFATCLMLGDHDDVVNGHVLKYLNNTWRIRDSF